MELSHWRQLTRHPLSAAWLDASRGGAAGACAACGAYDAIAIHARQG